ncbi:MAG: DUF1186 domain-containing protein [Acidobacteria bacterium]|nr:DUF1186 domain-containing protein [Acidobacteriota bacterium]
MEIQELLARLERHHGRFPGDLVAEIVSRREEAIPVFLQILEEIDADPEPWIANQQCMDHIYALYLLALFREPRAYPLLVRIFSRPGEFAFDLAGDVVTQDLGRVLASVSGGDTSGMTSLIENELANEWVRAAALSGLVYLVQAGLRTREDIMAYLLQLLHKLEPKPGAHWDTLANSCADLWPQEAMAELRRAYDQGLVNPQAIAWEDIEEALARGKEGAVRWARYREPLITEVAKDMSWMQCFQERDGDDRPAEPETDHEGHVFAGLPDDYTVTPVRRTAPKIGRNDPCPCGSGKKFKKCCGSQ